MRVQRFAAWLVTLLLLCGTVAAQTALRPQGGQAAGAQPAAAAAPSGPKRLPEPVTTHHQLVLSGRTLDITATAGAITISNADGVAQAQIGYIAYSRADLPAGSRPVTFAMNGGPGSGSAWLQLGLLGPWRLSMHDDAAYRSAPSVPVANDDTWLDFTDIVFIDPIGTGFSRLLVNSDDNRKKYYSVAGDVSVLSEAIRQWLEQAHRMASPKFLVGESYSGFRGPRLVNELANEQGVGISGLILISPLLDYGLHSAAFDLMGWVVQLPTLTAVNRARQGHVTRADLADVEAYATGDYAADLFKGEDPQALARRGAKVAALTGLDPALLARRHARLQDFEFLRETGRDRDAVASAYDATSVKADPFPENSFSEHGDPLTDTLAVPFTEAIYDIYATRLNWLPDGPYELSNNAVNSAWDYGRSGFTRPQSTGALRQDLAADPKLRVLIAHGMFDLVTPYFATQLQLNQIPPSVGRDRVTLEVYEGGHMFYARDAARTAFRTAAERLYHSP